MLLSRMKVKDGRLVTKDVEGYVNIGGSRVKNTPEEILKHVQKTFPNVKKLDEQNNPIFEESKGKNKDSITEGSKIVVNTENHVNETAIAITINEDNCLVRFENGDEETVPIENISAFESMANDAEKCMKDAMGTVIVRKGGYSIVEGVGTDSGWFFVTGKGENEKFKTKSQAEEYMDNCIEEDNTQDQSSTETETKINELKQNMDAARARGYDTAPYQKEIDRLKSLDENNGYVEISPETGGYDISVYQNGNKIKSTWKSDQSSARQAANIFADYYRDDNGQSLTIKFKGKDKYTGDPLTAKGQEIMASLKEQYGEEKGEQVFYAMKNSGQIEGIDSKTTKDTEVKTITVSGPGIEGEDVEVAVDVSPRWGTIYRIWRIPNVPDRLIDKNTGWNDLGKLKTEALRIIRSTY